MRDGLTSSNLALANYSTVNKLLRPDYGLLAFHVAVAIRLCNLRANVPRSAGLLLTALGEARREGQW